MPDKTEITNPDELIYGFAAGCLENEELLLLLELIISGKVNEVELGELQTVVSLLPTILELEDPPATLKDTIAKRLYEISKDINEKRKQKLLDKPVAKITPEIPSPEKVIATEEIAKEAAPESEGIEKLSAEDTSEENKKISGVEFAESGEKTSKKYAEVPPIKDEKTTYLSHKDIILQETKRENLAIIFTTAGIVFLLSIVAVIIIYFLNNIEIKKSTEKINILNNRVTALTKEYDQLNKLQRVFYVLTLKDAWVINLNGTVSNPTGFGKLIIDYQTKEGLMQFYNMPVLKPNQSYYLWLISGGQSFLLGTYKTRKDVEYLPINKLPDIPQNNIEKFVLTVEENNNLSTPRGLEYLAATVNIPVQ
jgi:hypothetical protein